MLCYAVFYGRRNLTKNPSLKLSGKNEGFPPLKGSLKRSPFEIARIPLKEPGLRDKKAPPRASADDGSLQALGGVLFISYGLRV